MPLVAKTARCRHAAGEPVFAQGGGAVALRCWQCGRATPRCPRCRARPRPEGDNIVRAADAEAARCTACGEPAEVRACEGCDATFEVLSWQARLFRKFCTKRCRRRAARRRARRT